MMGVLFKHVQYWLTKEIYRYPIKKCWYQNLHLMGVLFKHVQYWLTKEIYRYPIKKSKYVYSLPQHLSTYLDLNLHRCGKKKRVRKISLQWFFWYDVFFDNFVNYQWQIQESGHIRKTTKEEKFSAQGFFYRAYEDLNCDI
jgi:hypothetical protein